MEAHGTVARMLRPASLLARVLLAAAALLGPVRAEGAARYPAFGERGMVAASCWPATVAGHEIFERGGNAIDVGVATAFAVGVCEQYHSGVGGGGFLLIRDGGSGEIYALDARETAPAAASPDMYLDPAGQPRKNAARSGGLAVAVPGLLRGLLEAQDRFGRLSRQEILGPAIRIAEEGFPIGIRHRRVLLFAKRYGRFDSFPETARINLANGEVPPLGWVLRQPELARTLRAIAREGAAALYRGKVARAIVKAAREQGGILTLEDLAEYRTVWRRPVRGRYRGIDIVSFPPPSSGGVHLVEMLNTLEPFDLGASGANSSRSIHTIAEAMKLAFADRAAYLGDPGFTDVPVAWLTSKAYGRQLAARIAPRPFWRKPPWRWSRPHVLRVDRAGTPPPDDSGTSHISVLDREGNAVSITQTVNLLFGSGITVPGTGIVLNDEMDDFSIARDTPNAFGLVGQRANEIQPGKRPLSSMTPSLLLRDGQPWMVVGSPGGPRIITTVLLTILNVVDWGRNISEAVAAPRFHHQWRPDRLYLEPDFPRDVVDRLRSWGHPVFQSDRNWSSAQAILRDPESGILYGASDPRSDGRALGF
ncbi:MAG: gamma-glutamyltransferase [Myxococcota bacterium]